MKKPLYIIALFTMSVLCFASITSDASITIQVNQSQLNMQSGAQFDFGYDLRWTTVSGGSVSSGGSKNSAGGMPVNYIATEVEGLNSMLSDEATAPDKTNWTDTPFVSFKLPAKSGGSFQCHLDDILNQNRQISKTIILPNSANCQMTQ